MNSSTRPLVASILNTLPNQFDTHLVEQRFLRLNPIEFAEEVLRFRGSADPLRQFSMVYGQWIDQTFAGQIRKTKKVPSKHLGGTDSENQQWEKVRLGPIV